MIPEPVARVEILQAWGCGERGHGSGLLAGATQLEQNIMKDQLAGKNSAADWIFTTPFSKQGDLHYILWSRTYPYPPYMSVRVKKSPEVKNWSQNESKWGQCPGSCLPLPASSSSRCISLQEGWATDAGTYALTSRTSLYKRFWNLELVLQSAVLSEWFFWLFICITAGSQNITHSLIWEHSHLHRLHLTASNNFTLAPNFHFSCHRSRLPGFFCCSQLCFQIHEFEGGIHMGIYLNEKKISTNFHVCFLVFSSASIFCSNRYLYLFVIIQ